MRILITGIRGFKGTWLTHLLSALDHEIFGIDNRVGDSPLFLDSGAGEKTSRCFDADIRDSGTLGQILKEVEPEVVFHMAALPIVLDSFQIPSEYFDVNVVGTLKATETAEACQSVVSQIVVTSDKVFRETRGNKPHSIDDPLGGNDPYSASKASADFLIESRVASDPSWRTRVALARAGNVVGFGDQAPYRLIPSIIRAHRSGEILHVRNQLAVRPWQSVLDCLGGYVCLMQSLLSGQDNNRLSKWNFGPTSSQRANVRTIVDHSSRLLDFEAVFQRSASHTERGILEVDPKEAMERLGWKSVFTLEEVLDNALLPELETLEPETVMNSQIHDFLGRANYLQVAP